MKVRNTARRRVYPSRPARYRQAVSCDDYPPARSRAHYLWHWRRGEHPGCERSIRERRQAEADALTRRLEGRR